MTISFPFQHLKALFMTALFSVFLVASVGCGQKGPLYLPDQEHSSEKAEESKRKKDTSKTNS